MSTQYVDSATSHWKTLLGTKLNKIIKGTSSLYNLARVNVDKPENKRKGEWIISVRCRWVSYNLEWFD